MGSPYSWVTTRCANNDRTYTIPMAGDKITCFEYTVHLGISLNVKDKVNVEKKVSIGRKTAYSLMGAGFHSVNGLKTCLNGFIWNTFVVPRLIYGLEFMTLKKGEIGCLEKFQRKSLRQIQGLPELYHSGVAGYSADCLSNTQNLIKSLYEHS